MNLMFNPACSSLVNMQTFHLFSYETLDQLQQQVGSATLDDRDIGQGVLQIKHNRGLTEPLAHSIHLIGRIAQQLSFLSKCSCLKVLTLRIDHFTLEYIQRTSSLFERNQSIERLDLYLVVKTTTLPSVLDLMTRLQALASLHLIIEDRIGEIQFNQKLSNQNGSLLQQIQALTPAFRQLEKQNAGIMQDRSVLDVNDENNRAGELLSVRLDERSYRDLNQIQKNLRFAVFDCIPLADSLASLDSYHEDVIKENEYFLFVLNSITRIREVTQKLHFIYQCTELTKLELSVDCVVLKYIEQAQLLQNRSIQHLTIRLVDRPLKRFANSMSYPQFAGDFSSLGSLIDRLEALVSVRLIFAKSWSRELHEQPNVYPRPHIYIDMTFERNRTEPLGKQVCSFLELYASRALIE